MKTPHNPAVMKNGSLEIASRLPTRAAGHHHQALAVRIILSTKNRNQSIAVKQEPVGEASPASMMITGCASRKAAAHQAARSSVYWRASPRKKQKAVQQKSHDTRIAHSYPSEPVTPTA